MTQHHFTYLVTFCNGSAVSVRAANIAMARAAAHAQYAVCFLQSVWCAIVAIERIPRRGERPVSLYAIRLGWVGYRGQTGIKVLARDAAAAIAAARCFCIMEQKTPPHMDSIAVNIRNIGTGYDESILSYTG